MSHRFLILSAVAALGVLSVSACAGNPMNADVRDLNATTFLAFGDSITAGVIATCGGSPPLGTPLSAALHLLDTRHLIADLEENPGVSYPSVLASLLLARHPSQLVKVVNAGVAGEEIADGAARFPTELAATHPHVVFLLEGINDINQHGSSTAAGIATGYQTMIRAARLQGAEVIVSTILPERRGACRGYDWLDGVNDVVTVNAHVRGVALTEGATILDLYPYFETRVNNLLGVDGLHPNAAGYQQMANAFYTAVEKMFTRE